MKIIKLSVELSLAGTKIEIIHKIMVVQSKNLENWSEPYLPYINFENFSLKFIKTPSLNRYCKQKYKIKK